MWVLRYSGSNEAKLSDYQENYLSNTIEALGYILCQDLNPKCIEVTVNLLVEMIEKHPNVCKDLNLNKQSLFNYLKYMAFRSNKPKMYRYGAICGAIQSLMIYLNDID